MYLLFIDRVTLCIGIAHLLVVVHVVSLATPVPQRCACICKYDLLSYAGNSSEAIRMLHATRLKLRRVRAGCDGLECMWHGHALLP